MEVTVTIPDEFVKRLIPAHKKPSGLLVERLVDGACEDGQIDPEEANAILGRAIKAGPDAAAPGNDNSEAFRERYLSGQAPEWIDEPEQVRLHAAIAKFIGCLDDPDLPRSDQAREAVQESLLAQHARERRVG